MSGGKLTAISCAMLSLTFVALGQFEAADPGPRGAPLGVGLPVAGLSTDQTRYFGAAAMEFANPQDVSQGLGPTFNGNFCATCHSQPAEGGTSPSLKAFPFVGDNPQVALADADGATNQVPFFVKADGPVREARFKYFLNQDGSVNDQAPDGSVHDLFTIAGRQDAPGCTMPQAPFRQMGDLHNLSLRIPTPLFGAGLIESIDEDTILANMGVSAELKAKLEIGGVPNRSGNDASITRFGWKAQNKSLLMFAGEAYNVEIGETNELMPNERGYPPNPIPQSCLFNSQPEDSTNILPATNDPIGSSSDIEQFVIFMRFLDQPKPACTGTECSAEVQKGQSLFSTIGCNLCHTPSMTTSQSSFIPAQLQNVQANLFSDLLVHHMGTGLADDITQGQAGPDQFRTAPLWGIGQRVFFLHDGRTSDLNEAIRQHRSPGSEANQVTRNFEQLTETQKQDLLDFLRSL